MHLYGRQGHVVPLESATTAVCMFDNKKDSGSKKSKFLLILSKLNMTKMLSNQVTWEKSLEKAFTSGNLIVDLENKDTHKNNLSKK